MKHHAEMHEGPEAFTRFDSLVEAVFSVPRSEILKREAEYKKQSKLNPHRRGPKPKASASRVPPAAPPS